MRTTAISADAIVGIGIALLGVAFAVATVRIEVQPVYAKVGPTFVPWLVSGGLIVTGSLMAWAGLHAPPRPDQEVKTEWRPVAWIFAGLLADWLLFKPAGFIIASTVLFFCVARGFGTLYKSKRDAGYEAMVLKDPGGMKIAQNFNPQRNGGDVGNSWCGLAWNLEHLNDRAAQLAREGRKDWELDNLMKVHRGELPVLIHCASAEGVADAIRMWKQRYGTHCVVSHGCWDGWHAARFAAETGTPVNVGPRTENLFAMRREDRYVGIASEYMKAGVPLVSLNTDSPVVPEEELFLQGTVSARVGGESYQMLRALTANPAESFMIGDRVGSLEPGKDADVVLSSGDPLDPRSRVELVMIDGEVEYSRTEEGPLF